jgi:multiple sugar transport system substrate-binding protein
MPATDRSTSDLRRRLSYVILALLVAGIALARTAGCTQPPPTDGDSSPVAGSVVPLLVPRELGLADTWRIPISEWEAETGATCDVREYSAQPEMAELTKDGALVVCPLNQVPQLHTHAALAPVPEKLASGWQEVFDDLRKSVGSPGRKPAVFPLSAPPLLCFYRADLLEQAGLAPPATWTDYRRLAETVEEWAPGCSVVEPWGKDDRAWLFLQRSAGYALHPDNFSFTLDIANGEPLINQPPFVRALEEVQSDLVHLDPESLSMDPAECCLEVVRGHAALAIGMLPDQEQNASHSVESAAGATSGRIRVQRLPGATEVYHSQDQVWSDVGAGTPNFVTVVGTGAWVVCVVDNGHDNFAVSAWHLWNAIDSLEDRSSRVAGILGGGCRPSDFDNLPAVHLPGFDAELQQEYITAAAESLGNSRVVAELPFPEHGRYRQLLTQRLTEVLEEERNPQEALDDLAEDWKQLSAEVGASSVLNTYRWCLGLSPLPD